MSFSITDQPISVTRGKGFFTTSSLLNSTGETLSYKPSSFSVLLQYVKAARHETQSVVYI